VSALSWTGAHNAKQLQVMAQVMALPFPHTVLPAQANLLRAVAAEFPRHDIEEGEWAPIAVSVHSALVLDPPIVWLTWTCCCHFVHLDPTTSRGSPDSRLGRTDIARQPFGI
jgi:hypothetical protein